MSATGETEHSATQQPPTQSEQRTAQRRELDGKIVLVTGCGRGLGEAVCQVLAQAGAIIAAADIREEAADSVAAALRQRGSKAMPCALDVGDADQAAQVVDRVLSEFGRIDVLVNNAGTDVTMPIDELAVADWDRVILTNLRGPFLLCRQVFPHMKRQGGGQIVNVVSTAARRAWPNASAYHASKWGLLGLSHALVAEGRSHGIQVTALIAGGMRTSFLLDRFPDIDPGTLQDPANVAQAIRFVLTQPPGTMIPELMVLPMRETSWP